MAVDMDKVLEALTEKGSGLKDNSDSLLGLAKEVNSVISNRTRMIILNTPHNPSGTIMSEEDIEKLRKLVSGSKIIKSIFTQSDSFIRFAQSARYD